MLAIGGAAGAASFTHVHNVAAAHGQPGWLAWADAIVLELMSIASGLELRRRKRAHTSTVFPATVLGCAVTLSLAAQVVEAEPSPIGWTAAAVPALGFLVMVKVALGYTTVPRPNRDRTTTLPTTGEPDRTAAAPDESSPTRSTGSPPVPAPAGTGHPAADRDPNGPDRRPRSPGRGPSTVRDVRRATPSSAPASGTSSSPMGNHSPAARWPRHCAPTATPCPTPAPHTYSRSSKPKPPPRSVRHPLKQPVHQTDSPNRQETRHH